MHIACGNCRYPCHLTGLGVCESSEILQLWSEEEHKKPYGFDTAHQIHHKTGIQIAAVSFGGRANAQWKSANQDTFFYRQLPNDDTSSPHVPFLLGVIDGHGKHGGTVAHSVREAFVDMIDSCHSTNSIEYTGVCDSDRGSPCDIPGSNASASEHEEWLSACFARAAQHVDSLRDIDLSKSGAAAVVCAVHASRITTAWAGDSRAVLGLHVVHGNDEYNSSDQDDTIPRSPAAKTMVNIATTTTTTSATAAAIVTKTPNTTTKHTRLVLPLSRDHKPDPFTCPAESERIVAHGGRIDRLATDRYGNPIGPFRIFLPDAWVPGLALSRAFGDTLAKKVGVTSVPEVSSIMLPSVHHRNHAAMLEHSDHDQGSSNERISISNNNVLFQQQRQEGIYDDRTNSEDTNEDDICSPYSISLYNKYNTKMRGHHVLIVASDGLWEWMEQDAAMNLAWSMPTAQCAAEALAEYARKRWATVFGGEVCDDVTVAVAFIPTAV